MTYHVLFLLLKLNMESFNSEDTLIIFDEIQEAPKALASLNYFYEFVCAMGENQLAGLLESGDYEMINTFSTNYTELLKKYYYIGGMPEVVQTFIDMDDFYEVREVQKNLLKYYEEDFSKHAPKDVVPRIMLVWNSIPSQLVKEN